MKRYKCRFCESIVKFSDEEVLTMTHALDEINKITCKKGSSSSLLFEELIDNTMLCCMNRDYHEITEDCEYDCEHECTRIENPTIIEFDHKGAAIVEADKVCEDCGKKLGKIREHFKHMFTKDV